MIITKEFQPTHSEIGKPTSADMEAIRSFAPDKSVGEEDVFVVSMHLANDQYDRSHERFPVPVLQRFAETIVGKPVMVGHDKSREPAGRFFSGDVVPQPDGSHHLITRSYLDINDPLVPKIRKGIARDVSIGATADMRMCDVCGGDWDNRGQKTAGRCTHSIGHTYEEKLCRITWGGDLAKYEAQEGSFVYLGCQYGAGVIAQHAPSGITKTAAPGGAQILDYGAADPAPQGDDMELKEALEKIATLEGEIAALTTWKTETEPLIETGDIARKAALAEIQRKYTALEAEKTGQAIVKSLAKSSFTEIGDADKDAQEMYDKKFPPQPLGKPLVKSETGQSANAVRRGDRIGGMV
jgi:hypothetical protein